MRTSEGQSMLDVLERKSERTDWDGLDMYRGGGSKYISRRMIRLELPARRSRGRPKRRFMNVVKEDMKLVGVREEDAEDRVRWRQMIHRGDP